MSTIYRHKETLFLVSLMVLFTLIFFLGYSSYKTKTAIINMGIGPEMIDFLVMILSIAAIIRVIFLIKNVEVEKTSIS